MTNLTRKLAILGWLLAPFSFAPQAGAAEPSSGVASDVGTLATARAARVAYSQ